MLRVDIPSSRLMDDSDDDILLVEDMNEPIKSMSEEPLSSEEVLDAGISPISSKGQISSVFSSMVETMPQVKMAEYVKPSFMKFIEYLNPNYDVRIRVSVSDLLARIAQYYTDSFLDETIAKQVFEV